MDKKYFGAMIDLSKYAVMKPEQIKKFAKTIHSFGYNMLQLYIEDTYQVDGEPYFGYMRGRYTKEELKDVISYCNSIGVEVVPCMQTLAHLSGIFKWVPYWGINDTQDILLVGEERTYQLIENMFKTLRECFTTNLIHIGMDEALFLGLGKYMQKHGARNRFDILNEHLNRVVEISNKYGFKPQIWSDMYFRLANNGDYYGKSIKIPQSVKDNVPKEVALVYWDYYHTKKEDYISMLKTHLEFNNDIWFAGGAWTWKGFVPNNRFTMASMKQAMFACRELNVENIFITTWGDNGSETSVNAVIPSLFAIRRFFDGVTNMKQIKAEFKAITGESFDAMCALDLPDYIAGGSTSENPTKHMLYSDPFLGFLDSTITLGAGKKYELLAKRFTKYAKQSVYENMFKSIAKLCSVMSIKYELGRKTREFYQNGDKDGLLALAQQYKKAERKVEEFHEAFKNLWYSENKPFGFEVHDIRLGGLKQRLQSCRKTLIDYINGKIERIPELEESLLDYHGKEEYLSVAAKYHRWGATVSTTLI